MKTQFVAALLLAASILAPAQVKTIHFKKLQEVLPGDVFKGFERKKPTGSTQSQMGMAMSSAKVRFEEQLSDTATVAPVTVEVEVQDMVGMPYALMVYTQMQEFENETESGYEKTVTVKGKYKGIEKGGTDDSKFINVNFGVASRYIVTVEINGRGDEKFLTSVVDAVKLDALEKLTSEK